MVRWGKRTLKDVNDLQEILNLAREKNASDIHMTAGSPLIFRVNSRLRAIDNNILTNDQVENMARSIMIDEQWDKFQEKGDLDFSYSGSDGQRFRVNIYKQRNNMAVCIRVIDSKIPTVEDLDLPIVIPKLTKKSQGLFLITGPTGSGKSTTLAALIDYINKTQTKHIITLEDPIEYVHQNRLSLINQREVGTDTESFAAGLRSALRQDPDVILVGEMRDLETISTAITAAETGHLVLGTLHTADAVQTIDRIIDVFPPAQQQQIRIQFASVLVGVVSQRLFPTKDGTSRVAAMEILINNSAISNLIRTSKTHQIQSVLETSKLMGMQTLKHNVQTLINSGIIDSDVGNSALFGFEDMATV